MMPDVKLVYELERDMSKHIASRKIFLAIILGLVSIISTANAHHSFAMFDKDKTIEENGATVKEFHWANPHTFVVVDVKKDGVITSYTLECNSINLMTKAGWKFNTLKTGDKVDITYHPLRSGEPGGMLMTIKLPDGNTLKAW